MNTITVNPLKVYLSQLGTEESARTTTQYLSMAVKILTDGESKDAFSFDWTQIRYPQMAYIRAELIKRKYAPSTCNRLLSNVRSLLLQCWTLNLISSDDYQRSIQIKPVIGSSLPPGRMLTQPERNALFDNCKFDGTVKGVRDTALIMLAYNCGMRRGEIVKLLFENYDKDAGTIIIDGKRNKRALGYILPDTITSIENWLDLRGRDKGYLFYSVSHWGIIDKTKAMTANAIYQMIAIRAKEAGIKGKVTPHDLRRSFCSDLLAAKVDVFTVAKLSRHSNIATLQKYDRRNIENTKKEALEKLNL